MGWLIRVADLAARIRQSPPLGAWLPAVLFPERGPVPGMLDTKQVGL
jgi:hypothetical protein